MSSPSLSRLLRATVVLAVGAAGALAVTAAPAQAASGSSSGADQYVTSSVTLDNTTPVPGSLVTFTVHTTTQEASFLSAGLAFSAAWGSNLALESCGGDITTADCSVVGDTIVYAHAPSGTSTVRIVLRVAASAPAGTAYTVTPFVDYFAAGASHQLVLAPTLDLAVAEGRADLAIGLTASSGLLTNRVAYTTTARNLGPQALLSATVATNLPVAAAGFSSPDGCVLTGANRQVRCPVAGLGVGSTATRRFTVTYPLLTVGLSLTSTATRAASSPTDPNAANDSASVRCLAIAPVVIAC